MILMIISILKKNNKAVYDMIKYFKITNKLNISKKTKIKCYIEIIINIILRIIFYYPLNILALLFYGIEKIFDFITNIFLELANFSKENICIGILNKNEMDIFHKELKKYIKNS